MRNILPIFAVLAVFVLVGCKKDYPKFKDNILAPTLIEVHNVKISNVTEQSATVNFDINVFSMDSIKSAGIVYSTAPSPELGQENSVFIESRKIQWTKNTVKITDFDPSIKYYLKAVAVHNSGTAFYSETYTFSASDNPIDNDDDDDEGDDDDTTQIIDYFMSYEIAGSNKINESKSSSHLRIFSGYYNYVGDFITDGIGFYFNHEFYNDKKDFPLLEGRTLPIIGKDEQVPGEKIAAVDIVYANNSFFDKLYSKYASPSINTRGFVKINKVTFVEEQRIGMGLETYYEYLIEGEFECSVAREATPNSVITLKNGKFKIPVRVD